VILLFTFIIGYSTTEILILVKIWQCYSDMLTGVFVVKHDVVDEGDDCCRSDCSCGTRPARNALEVLFHRTSETHLLQS